jgi:ADP-ribosylglycohydrolase
MRTDYGELEGMVASKATHAESMVQGMSYAGTIDIMHDKARFYAGNKAAELAQTISAQEIEKRRDDHGNYVGALAEDRVHYHASLLKGQNTANVCIARLAMRYIAETNSQGGDFYDPNDFLKRLYTYMVTPPDPTRDIAQMDAHNDVYMDVYLRGFFTRASNGSPLSSCALSQRDTWSIGSLDGVVMSIPIIAAYSNEPVNMVTGRAVEHHMLTHRSVTVTAVVSVLVPILLELYRGGSLRETLDKYMEQMKPPAMTGRDMRDSYVKNHGPGNIPKHEKWLQHMLMADETTKELVHRLLDEENDENVAGWGDQPESRLGTACYCEQAFAIVLYLAYKYADDPKKALLQNAKLGGESCFEYRRRGT